MINKKQKKLNNKELAKSIGIQLANARREKQMLLSDMKKYYNYSPNHIDTIESGLKLGAFQELIYIASLYDKKLEVNVVDA